MHLFLAAVVLNCPRET
jgi:hypothetical protein